ncbi:hypothetical protein NB705_003193 [Xanthomonas sacchari]|nr:hypothetical protein [Xanthomonas sacchari]
MRARRGLHALVGSVSGGDRHWRRVLGKAPLPPGDTLRERFGDRVDASLARVVLQLLLPYLRTRHRRTQRRRRRNAIAGVVVGILQHQQRSVGADQAEARRQRLAARGRSLRIGGKVAQHGPHPGARHQVAWNFLRLAQRHTQASGAGGGGDLQVQRRIGAEQAPGDAQVAIVGVARIGDQIGDLATVQRDQFAATSQQPLAGQLHARQALQCDRTSAARFRDRRQARGIGVRAGRVDRIQALPRRQRRHGLRAVVAQAIAEQQILLHLRRRLPGAQRTGAVGLLGLQRRLQGVPVAVAHLEPARRRGTVAQHDQIDLGGADRGEIALQQGQFGRNVALPCRTGRIPEQADALRQRARAMQVGDRHQRLEVALAIVETGRHARRGACAQRQHELRRQLRRAAGPGRGVATVRRRQQPHAGRRRAFIRRGLGTQRDLQRPRADRIRQRQAPLPAGGGTL